MLNIEECRKFLKGYNEEYTDGELLIIMDLFSKLAKINAKLIDEKVNKIMYEKSCYNGQSE